MTIIRPLLFLLLALFAALPAQAHPAPFSYLDLHLREDRIDGTLRIHTIDAAHILGEDRVAVLFGQDTSASQQLTSVLENRLQIGDARPLWGRPRPLLQDEAIEIPCTIDAAPPPAFQVDSDLFPYDPQHQTFVNIYEGDALRQQWIFAGDTAAKTHFAGTTAGVLATLATFIPSGVEHILIGPDHIAFVIGLLLLGGTLRRIALVVTGFTLGHSITLSLAALDILALPPSIVEPAIALSIVVIGLDNLLRGEGRDIRPWLAVVFGLVHGFGFASVLREFGLPQANLAWSLLGFNLGVEIGQLLIVLPLAAALLWLRRRHPRLAGRIAVAGSLAVTLAGAYWFFERVL